MHSLIPATGVSVASRVKQEARVDRFKLAACGLVGAVVLSGCSAGQVSQTAIQEAAVNGTSANIGEVAVRNVASAGQPDRRTTFSPGVKSNSFSSPPTVRRTSTTSWCRSHPTSATVTLTGDTRCPPTARSSSAPPTGRPRPLDSVEAAKAAKATVQLSKPISNGLTYDFTFKFEQAGEGTVARADLGR